MQIQGTGEIGSTKRKFHLSGVPLIESRLYVWHLVQISCEKSFAVLSQTGKYFAESVKTRKKCMKVKFK